MKKTYSLAVISTLICGSALAASYTITGKETLADPAKFSVASDWGGSVPSLSKADSVMFQNASGNTSAYFLMDIPDTTVGSISTITDADSDFYITTGTNTLTIDINATNSSFVNAILFNNTANNDKHLTLDGKYVIQSTGSTSGINALARIGIVTPILSADVDKKIILTAGSTIDSYTALSLSGTVGAYGSYEINGTINTYNGVTAGTGKLNLDWAFGPYVPAVGGTRTKVNVSGTINTGDLFLHARSILNVNDGGTVYANAKTTFGQADASQSGTINVNSGGTFIADTIEYFDQNAQHTGAQTVTVNTGGHMTATTVTQRQENSIMTIGGAATVTNYSLKEGKLNVTNGGVLDITNFTSATPAAGKTGTITLSGTGELKTGGTFTLGGTTLLAFSTSGSAAGKLTLKGTSDVTYAGTSITMQATSNIRLLEGAKFTASDLTINSGKFSSEKNTTSKFNTLTLSSNAILDINGKLEVTKVDTASNFFGVVINSGSSLIFGADSSLDTAVNNKSRISLYGNLKISSATNTIKALQIVVWSRNNTIDFSSANALVSTNGIRNTVMNITQGNKANLIVRATTELGQLILQSDTSTLTGISLDLQFTNANDFISFSDVNVSTPEARLYVTNFENNRIKFINNVMAKPMVVYDAISGDIIDTEWVSAAGGGWWLNAVIPEPAEWAAIFGAIALGFAVYRRKSLKR